MARPRSSSTPRKRFRRRLVAVMLLAGLLPVPTVRLQRAAAHAIDVELARWATLLDGAPERPLRDVAPELVPLTPPPAPVY